MFRERKIKILECIRQGQIGGGESHLLSLVGNLDRDRFEPLVLSFTDGPMIERLGEMGVERHVIHTEKPFDVGKWKTVREFMRDKQIDLVHAHGTRASSNVLWAARRLKIPVIYTVHGWSFHQDQHPLKKRLRIWGEKYITSNTQLNISVSKSNQESGQKYLPAFQSVVINNGIDLERFDPARPFADVRRELGIGSDQILVLFIARFTGHKQPLSLLRAFAELAPLDDRLHLLMVGDGDQKEDALAMRSQFRLGDRVTFAGFRQDVPDVLAAADIFVLPSLWEGLPIGLLEAMAMGKAVIATNVDGSREIVRNEHNGLLVSTDGLVNHLKAAIMRLASDGMLRELLGEAAVKTVSHDFNAAAMTRKIENLYTTIAGGSPSGSINGN